ncbi:MAG: transposase [Deltaproteobacteria bacterium]|nr:transposase [Deltaproteobacteria bacterium]MBW1936597.1 transposase [Deltaproteobacteria bacterium]MBW1978141.1 transposase [Deltaproteobacteria bacterium]MBW2046686.1 transposase [Deltaproteobacteria bacterium]MBW2301008.1 transposase [Deltaproteobacteria bacterium]
MPRPHRINIKGGFYHILTRGNNRQDIFFADTDEERFLGYLEKYAAVFKYKVHCYCLMPNHIHLLLETEEANLSKIMQRLLSAYTLYFNKKHNQTGHLFQGRFKSLVVEKDDYLIELSRYIHLNPVRANIVKKPEDYRWSSLGYYLGGRSNNFLWVEDILSPFGGDGMAYLEFVYEGIDREFTPSITQSLYLGSKDFIKKIKDTLGENETEEKQESDISFARLKEGVCKYFQVSPDDITKARRREHDIRQSRKVLIYLARQYTPMTLSEIGVELGGASPQLVSNAFREVELDKNLRELATTIFSQM